MSEAISGLFWLRDPRLAPLALGPWPAWAWSLDGARLLFANPTGAAIFGAETPAALAACRFEGSDVAALGAEALAAGADSHAEGDTIAGKLTVDRVGTVLFTTFGAAPAPMSAPMARRQPLRFVWQIDADGRFTLDSEEFATLAGAHAVL